MSLLSSIWPSTNLGALCEQIRGVTYSRGDAHDEPADGLVPVLRANNILDDGLLLFDDLVYVPAAVVADAQYIQKYDIVIAASSGSLSVVGKAAQAKDGWRGGFGAFCKVLRPNKGVEPRYLSYFFRTPHYRQRISQLAAGANINNLRNEHLNDLEIPLPPLPEQKRIADILDKADAIRRKRREVNEQVEYVVRSAFQEWFGCPFTNNKGFPTAKLGVAATLDRGRSRHRPRDAAFLYGGPYPFVQTGDIANSGGYVNAFAQTYSEEGLSQSKLWPEGTLCITIAANIAKTAILAIDACFPDSVVGLLPGPELTTEYVRYWFVSMEEVIDKYATQVAQKNINLELLRSLDIVVPPLSLQQHFTEFVKKVQQFRKKDEAACATTSDLFNSLVQRAFRGEL